MSSLPVTRAHRSAGSTAPDPGGWQCGGGLPARRPASNRHRRTVCLFTRAFSRLYVSLCRLGHRCSGNASGGRLLPEPGCGPCSSSFRGNLHVAARSIAAGHCGCPPAPFNRDYADLRQSGRDRSATDCSTLAGGAAMLAQAVESYLEVRRACGFELKSQGNLLRNFAAFSTARGKHHVCREIAIEWAGLARSIHQRARRLSHVIRFTRYVRAEDQSHELPPAVFGNKKQLRPIPYIFSQNNIGRLVQAASQSGYCSLRRQTYSTLFALLACTGLRVSEAIHLRFEDITPDSLVIRCSKFHKSRLVPLHETAQVGLERYLEHRHPYAPFDDHVFVSLRRKPLLLVDVDAAFRTAVDKIGLRRGPRLPRPTPHSLRHTFAVRALEACPDGRDSVTEHMLALSTYLGHGKISDTYWYLEATPDLMRSIAKNFETFVTAGRP